MQREIWTNTMMAIYAGIFAYDEQGSVQSYWKVTGKPEVRLSYNGIARDLERLGSKCLLAPF